CSSCPNPTVVKVPVVKQIGHIEGPTDICATGKQYRYRLPQWPATVFQWSLQTTTGAKLIATDQPNEYIIQTGSAGIITLKVTYNNTLLGCTGSAISQIQVSQPPSISGPLTVCAEGGANSYSLSTGEIGNWLLT